MTMLIETVYDFPVLLTVICLLSWLSAWFCVLFCFLRLALCMVWHIMDCWLGILCRCSLGEGRIRLISAGYYGRHGMTMTTYVYGDDDGMGGQIGRRIVELGRSNWEISNNGIASLKAHDISDQHDWLIRETHRLIPFIIRRSELLSFLPSPLSRL